MHCNLILDTDSYKASHFVQYPPGTTSMFSYLESRGGRYDRTVFFGLQYLLKEYFSTPVTRGDISEAEDFFAAHGEPFFRYAWERVVDKFGGYLPLHIRAVDEGTIVPTHNVLMTVESTDADTFTLAGWMETMLVRLWYPITVATQSYMIKRVIFEALQKSADDPMAEINFKLHDFGSRGVSSRETAGIGGMAHLVNFMGSDTIEGIRFANHYYKHPMSAFSIPAAEHSTITSWGRENEEAAYRNMIRQFGGTGKLVACVSDSYDVYAAVEHLWGGSLHDEVKASGGTLVIRPDSGEPVDVILKLLSILDRKVGMTTNSKGYKVLPSYFRLIQGDGVNETSIKSILDAMMAAGYSASNIAFGMGGALLQQVNRDTQKFAYKCSSVTVEGVERDVAKNPVTDPGKKSKAGRLDLVHCGPGLLDVTTARYRGDVQSCLSTIYRNGEIPNTTTLDEVRARVNKTLF